jgi:pimeloyl-ACP methyl ester carboxylesterase
MQTPIPGYKEAGQGPSIVCLHGSGSSSSQWRSLMHRLSNRFRLIAPDLYGHGNTPPWQDGHAMYIDDELDLLEHAFQLAGDRFHLVGHSWGGAIALKAVLRHLPRVQSVVLFEPALWSLLIADDPCSNASREIVTNRDETQRLMDQGNFVEAGEYFIDYWLDPGAWKHMTKTRRSTLVDGMRAASPEWYASFHETTPLSAFATLSVPTLLLSGKKSTTPARTITALLSSVLPHARLLELEDIGHMGPVTHPEVINGAIEDFLTEINYP